MRIVNGMVEMKLDGYPGDIGDSCAETSRLALLRGSSEGLNLAGFKVNGVWRRHPETPDAWTFSGDQAFPLLLAGSGDISLAFKNPGCFAAYFKLYILLELLTIAQALLFLIPYRWSDDNRDKGFVRSEGSSADYLNFFMGMLVLHRAKELGFILKKLVPKHRLEGKIASYYLNQPNSAWFTDLYFKCINEVYGGS
jgi:hypothetical protein